MENSTALELEEILLYSARHGDVTMVKELLSTQQEGNVTLDISCKGKSKSNQGWTPLHLATYFGHKSMMELLLDNGADINALNNAGDTALHKAAFIGREDLVLLLLERGADVGVMNGEGQTPRCVAEKSDVRKLLLAAEQTDNRRREERLLDAAREGDLDLINELLKGDHPPNINCVDTQGNSCLHCAAYRGHKEAAVLLLQNGIDTKIKNNRGQLAVDLAKDSQTQQVLSVQPIRRLVKSAARFEGMLLKRSRFLGWKPVWKWLNAFQEHAAFSSHYLRQGQSQSDSDEDEPAIKPLGSMQDALQTAAAHHQLLAQQLADSASILDSIFSSNEQPSASLELHRKFQLVSDSAAGMLTSLNHCLNLFQQQEEVRILQLKQEQERVRVLEEALHVLAREHHELEQSVALSQAGSPTPLQNHSRFFDTSDDEFYDAFEADSDSDTLVTAATPDSDTLRSFNLRSLHESSSSSTLVSGACSPLSFHSALDRPHGRHRRSSKHLRSAWPALSLILVSWHVLAAFCPVSNAVQNLYKFI